MALFRTSLFGGALFAGALFGAAQSEGNQGAGAPPVKRPSHANLQYWAWVGDRFIYADTAEAIREAIERRPEAPTLQIASTKIKLPKPPKAIEKIPQYIAEVTKYADAKRTELKAKHERDEIALLLLTLGIVESDQLVIVG